MSAGAPESDGFVVDAAILAEAFDLTLEETRRRMRGGQIVTRSETGQGEDAGRWRLTFRHADRALRLVVDDSGEILEKSTSRTGHPNLK